MWNLIKLWLEKKACKHDWKQISEIKIVDSADGQIPTGIRVTYKCLKCGDFTQINL